MIRFKFLLLAFLAGTCVRAQSPGKTDSTFANNTVTITYGNPTGTTDAGFTVPAGVTSVAVDVFGATGSCCNGGAAGRVRADLAVTPGEN